VSLVTVNGVEFHVIDEGEGIPLLMLHGFTGTAAGWSAIAKELVSRWRVVRVDLLGHGLSSRPDDPRRYALELAASDLLGLMDALGIEEFAVAGYSFGGRVALHLAVRAPERIKALILESASYGIADPSERAARRARDEALARELEEQGIEAFVRYWENLPLFETQRRLPEEVREAVRRERLGQSPAGLANSLRGAGAGTQEFLAPKLSGLSLPALVIAGSLDAKYAAVAREMANLFPRGRLCIVEGAGHNVHLERPAQYLEAVAAFLTEHLSSQATPAGDAASGSAC